MRMPSWNVIQWNIPGAISCITWSLTGALLYSGSLHSTPMLRQGRHVVVLALALCALCVSPALADPPPPGSKLLTGDQGQYQFFTESDGTELHADVLRPAGIPDTQKTPVILSIGPY